MSMSFVIDGKELTFSELEQEIRKDERKKVLDKISHYIEQPKNSIFWDASLYVPTDRLRKLIKKLRKGENSGKTTDNLQ